MDFKVFSVGATNVFPNANSTTGNQLCTEFNMRSRESIPTDQAVKYMIGPSYTHSMDDFYVRIQEDGAGTQISSSVIEILPGRALVNGHYMESFMSVLVDLSQANAEAKKNSLPPLKGKLVIGLRAFYATNQTLAGSLRDRDSGDMLQGIQVVVLPPDEFKLPSDVPNEEEKVTAHLKLAEFYFVNGQIKHDSIIQNADKTTVMPADRISNIEGLLSDIYVRKTGLDPKRLYTFSGKGTDPQTGYDTWCDSTDSLMVWDMNPKAVDDDPGVKQADFGTDSKGQTTLVIPHKQVDFNTDTAGNKNYYAPRMMTLPLADYNAETAGTINGAYTKHIKQIRQLINQIYQIPAGKQRAFIDVLDDRKNLPPINTNWSVGDYVLVQQDNTVIDTVGVSSTMATSPSTLYVIIPGFVQEVKFTEQRDDNKVPTKLTGVEIGTAIRTQEVGESAPNTANVDEYNAEWGFPSQSIRGTIGTDFFKCQFVQEDKTTNYYYEVSKNTGAQEYSNPIFVTGGVPLATTEMIGGFLNVPETSQDYGYVYLDSDGHLRLLDYGLLRSGVLAYQLGQDYSFGPGLTTEEIQNQLDEYVNNRVAFPTSAHQASAAHSNVITITIELEAEESPATLNINNIDSRFGTSVCLDIIGKADKNTTINISDCEKVRVRTAMESSSSPTINLYRCGLYYDASVIDSLSIISDMKLWYERFEDTDPNLVVDDMTVIEVDAPVIPEDIDYWSEDIPNDNHFMYALQSITFANDGTIIRCGLYIKNQTSANVTMGTNIIVSKFTLPQGAGLTYPLTCLTKPIKISGSFVTAYPIQSPKGYTVISTQFSAVTSTYDEYSADPNASGTISFFNNAQIVDNFAGVQEGTNIDSWSSNSYHTFYGSVIG